MKGLSETQREAVLKLGNTESAIETISRKVLQELIDFGLVYKRESDGNFDFAELGECVCDELKERSNE